MAKIISVITAIFLGILSPFLFLFSRDGRALGKATIVLEASSFPVGTETITVTRYNGTLRSIPHGVAYRLEKWDGSAWRLVAPKDSYVPDAMIMLRPFKHASVTCDLTNYDPPLEAGRYRVEIGGAYAEFTLVAPDGKVTLTTEFGSYPVGTREIKAELYNGSLETFSYTVGYRIDKFTGGEWVTVGPNLGFIALMRYLAPGCGETFDCELSCNEPLDAGRYRIAVRGVFGEFTLV